MILEASVSTNSLYPHFVVLSLVLVLLHTDAGLERHHPFIYGDVLIRLEICLAGSHYAWFWRICHIWQCSSWVRCPNLLLGCSDAATARWLQSIPVTFFQWGRGSYMAISFSSSPICDECVQVLRKLWWPWKYKNPLPSALSKQTSFQPVISWRRWHWCCRWDYRLQKR